MKTLIILAFLLHCGPKSIHGLSVTNYDSLQISMVKHGETYASDDGCYTLEDIQPKYHGMTHIRGLNDKEVGDITFSVDVPVRVYLGIDSRSSYTHGADYEDTGDWLVLAGCYGGSAGAQVYKSVAVHGPGQVTINFSESRKTMIFLRDARLINPDAELKIVQPANYGAKLSMVRDGEKFSTDRACYQMVDIPARFHGLTHVRLLNDVPSPIVFDVSVPVVVYVAIDSRYPNPISTEGFVDTGEKIVHGGCVGSLTDFPIHSKSFAPGEVKIELNALRMLTVLVEPVIDNTFKTRAY